MKASPAKREFKKRFGQANHFLITALVGIEGIQSGLILDKPETFRTSWNPKDKKRSADRTRFFILKSFLGWAVESLEMYMTELNRKPKLLESERFTTLFSKAGQSIYKKTTFIADEIDVDPILTGLMEVLITWRNYTFHYDIDNEIRESSMSCLLDNAEAIQKRFSGLEIAELKTTWENGRDFTFKETASLIRACQDFVSEIDAFVISSLDMDRFLFESAIKHFRETEMSRKRFISFGNERRINYLKTLLRNLTGAIEIEERTIQRIMIEINNEQKSV